MDTPANPSSALDFFISLYRTIPAWVVAFWAGTASLGFFFRFFFVRNNETLRRYPYGSLAAAAALAIMALNYLLIQFGAYSSMEVAAGGVRVFLVLMGVSLTYFTRDGYEAALSSWRPLFSQFVVVLRIFINGRWAALRQWLRGRRTQGEHYTDDDDDA